MSDKHVVLFLGAGFSKAINDSLPLGENLLDRIETHLQQQGGSSIIQLIRRLLPDPGVPSPQIQRFELLLGILERLQAGEANGRPSLLGVPADQVWRSIIAALSAVVRFDHSGYARYSEPYTPLGDFIGVLQQYRDQLGFSIVTTNYDLIADKAAQWVTDQSLGYAGASDPPKDLRRVQYGLPVRGVWASSGGAQPQFVDGYRAWSRDGGIPVYKLHGSTNWAFCSVCGVLDLSQTRLEVVAVFRDESSAATCPVCGARYRWIIVPPVLNKRFDNDLALAPVWRAAEHVLELATTVIFIGYSLPSADPIVVQMVATARWRSANRPRGPWSCYVADPEPDVHARYKAVFGAKYVTVVPDYFKPAALADLCRQIVGAGP